MRLVHFQVDNDMIVPSYLGCGCCGNGIVAFVLAEDGSSVVVFCTNCGAWYTSTDRNQDGELIEFTFVKDPKMFLSGVGCSVQFPPARWATKDEISASKWGTFITSQCMDIDWKAEDEEWWSRRIHGII